MNKSKTALIVGFLFLVVPFGAAMRDYWFAPADNCEAKSTAAIPKSAGLLYTDQKEFYLNSVLCIAVQAESYFSSERMAIDSAKAAVKSAQNDVAQAGQLPEPARTQKLQEANTKLTTAQAALVTAETALAAQAPAKPAFLFIDDIRTPSSLDVYISNPKSSQDGWTWRSLKVRAPDDANSDAAKQWRLALSGMPLEGSRPVVLGLGDKADKEGKEGLLPRKDAVVRGVTFRLYHWPILVLGALGLALVAGGLIGLGWNTGLLRDTPPPPPASQLAPFSLARVQFAWWLFLGIGGFLYVWLVTGQYIGVVTAGVLALMGISGVSGLAAQKIDPTPNPDTSDGFFRDIMSEGKTFVLQRVQMAAWTFILGVIFLWTALTSFSFPNFDPNLLVLAGIVNGVYLGFKFKT